GGEAGGRDATFLDEREHPPGGGTGRDVVDTRLHSSVHSTKPGQGAEPEPRADQPMGRDGISHDAERGARGNGHPDRLAAGGGGGAGEGQEQQENGRRETGDGSGVPSPVSRLLRSRPWQHRLWFPRRPSYHRSRTPAP